MSESVNGEVYYTYSDDIVDILENINVVIVQQNIYIAMLIKIIGILISVYVVYILYRNILKPWMGVIWRSFKI